jgi:hypothetical protein
MAADGLEHCLAVLGMHVLVERLDARAELVGLVAEQPGESCGIERAARWDIPVPDPIGGSAQGEREPLLGQTKRLFEAQAIADVNNRDEDE